MQKNFGKSPEEEKKAKLIRANQILISNELSAADLLSLSKTKLSGLVSVMGGPEVILQ